MIEVTCVQPEEGGILSRVGGGGVVQHNDGIHD